MARQHRGRPALGAGTASGDRRASKPTGSQTNRNRVKLQAHVETRSIYNGLDHLGEIAQQVDGCWLAWDAGGRLCGAHLTHEAASLALRRAAGLDGEGLL